MKKIKNKNLQKKVEILNTLVNRNKLKAKPSYTMDNVINDLIERNISISYRG